MAGGDQREAGTLGRLVVTDGELCLIGAGFENLDGGALDGGWGATRVGGAGWTVTVGGLDSVLGFVIVTGVVARDCGRLFWSGGSTLRVRVSGLGETTGVTVRGAGCG